MEHGIIVEEPSMMPRVVLLLTRMTEENLHIWVYASHASPQVVWTTASIVRSLSTPAIFVPCSYIGGTCPFLGRNSRETTNHF